MKKHILFPFVVVLCVLAGVCLGSCGARTENANDIDELGDTVPASEFSVVEDTDTTANDTVVAVPVKKK
jgi:hypothetical protein